MTRHHILILRPDSWDDQHRLARSNELIKHCLDVLERHSAPDTFLGRAQLEPIPLPYQEE